ncbi:MAG: GNAT family N-acetyltransferase [Flavobacteriaceae bacterium]|nr:GNAT family N-acetyltransferase [Flavobacteriaceae bacterium]
MLKTKGYTIRVGDRDDIPSMIKLGKQLHEESPRFMGMDYSEDKLFDLGKVVAEQGGLFIAEHEGKIVGMLVGLVSEHFFGHDLMASDLTFYIDKEHRGGTLGVRLMRQFEAWAKCMGARVISLGISTEIDAKRTGELYLRMGYRVTGEMFVKETGL